MSRPILPTSLSRIFAEIDRRLKRLEYPASYASGITVPSFTTAQKTTLTGVAAGTIVYDSTAGQVQAYQGGSWVPL